MKMELTKRQEKQLNKVINDPKKLRKWVDDVYSDMVAKNEEKTGKTVGEYLDIYSVAVAYTLHRVCGFGKKRLPEIMENIWKNIESFEKGHLHITDCVEELKENGIILDDICEGNNLLTNGQDNKKEVGEVDVGMD